jgi:hypothetical protein
LKEAKFKTLKDFYGVIENNLIDGVKGVGNVNAIRIMKVINIELKKYKIE